MIAVCAFHSSKLKVLTILVFPPSPGTAALAKALQELLQRRQAAGPAAAAAGGPFRAASPAEAQQTSANGDAAGLLAAVVPLPSSEEVSGGAVVSLPVAESLNRWVASAEWW